MKTHLVAITAILIALAVIFSPITPSQTVDEWWASCLPDPASRTPWPPHPTLEAQPTYPGQPTYTSEPSPTCRPTATLAPNPSLTPYHTNTPYPTHTPYPTSTPYPTQPYTTTITPEPTGTPTNTPTPLASEAYYVATDGDDGNLGTETQPFRTINRGISVLDAGDTLYVKVGTYAEQLYSFPSGSSWDEPVTIAAYLGDEVIIKPAFGGKVAQFSGCHHIALIGFVFDASNVTDNAIKVTNDAHHIRIQDSEVRLAPRSGILVTSPDSNYNEFIRLDVHHNGTTTQDHGLYISTSNNLVDYCTVHNNEQWGIHVYNGAGESSSNVVSNNAVFDNHNGIVLSCGAGNLAYNNLVWSQAYLGIQIHTASDTEIYNNTLHANGAYGIHIQNTSANALVRNNIIYQSDSPVSDAGSNTTLDHNLIDIDPLFVDALAHDFHLQPTSLAIDAGITLSEVLDDRDSISRPQGAGYDMGAYEQ